jgi:transketolase
MLASQLKLDNLVCIVDFNNSQIRSLPLEQIESKFASFGWESNFVEDGHNIDDIVSSLKAKSSKPLCIVLRTVKGYGLESLQNDMFAWHHRSPNDEELIRFLREIESE